MIYTVNLCVVASSQSFDSGCTVKPLVVGEETMGGFGLGVKQ